MLDLADSLKHYIYTHIHIILVYVYLLKCRPNSIEVISLRSWIKKDKYQAEFYIQPNCVLKQIRN